MDHLVYFRIPTDAAHPNPSGEVFHATVRDFVFQKLKSPSSKADVAFGADTGMESVFWTSGLKNV